MCNSGTEIELMTEEKNDMCVSCNKKTKYHKNENIHNRMHYIEGAGQLCENCWIDIYDINRVEF